MPEVQTNFKDNWGECGCSCGREGPLRAKPWKSNGVRCVKRGCTCAQCRGLRNKRMGAAAQRKGKKTLGLKSAGSIHTGHEESDLGEVRWESKYGKSFTGPIYTAYLKAESQSELQRPIGDVRPFVFYARNAGSRFGLITFREDRIDEVILALARGRGLIE